MSIIIWFKNIETEVYKFSLKNMLNLLRVLFEYNYTSKIVGLCLRKSHMILNLPFDKEMYSFVYPTFISIK